jgi:hypothetical protein
VHDALSALNADQVKPAHGVLVARQCSQQGYHAAKELLVLPKGVTANCRVQNSKPVTARRGDSMGAWFQRQYHKQLLLDQHAKGLASSAVPLLTAEKHMLCCQNTRLSNCTCAQKIV